MVARDVRSAPLVWVVRLANFVKRVFAFVFTFVVVPMSGARCSRTASPPQSNEVKLSVSLVWLWPLAATCCGWYCAWAL